MDDATVPSYEDDGYVGMEVSVQKTEGGDAERYKVKRRRVDPEGNLVGTPNTNPILDTRQYECESVSGNVEFLAANVIAENLLSQVDDEGHR